jgi:hypothetical protein
MELRKNGYLHFIVRARRAQTVPSENRKFVTALRRRHEEEIETMVRQMKIDGGTLEECIAELRLLAEFVRSQADGLTDAWPSLLKDTYSEYWKRGQSEKDAAG